MIKPEELRYEHPKKAFMKTSNSEVYKGEYRGFTVAIKRYTGPLNTSPRSVLISVTKIKHWKMYFNDVSQLRKKTKSWDVLYLNDLNKKHAELYGNNKVTK